MNLANILEGHPDDSVALISRGRTTTYGELRDQVARLRGGLADLDLQPGDRVAIAAGNNWYFVVSYLAVIGSGLIAVPLNPASPAAALEHELRDVSAAAAIIGPTVRSTWDDIDSSSIDGFRHVIGAGFEPEDGHHLDALMESAPVPVVDVQPSQEAILIFTSGTAGSPRPAVLTHANLAANIQQVLASQAERQRADDVVFGLLPMFHIFGLNVMLGLSLATGSQVLLIERFDPASALEAIERHSVSVIAGPPTMWAAFAGLPGIGPEAFATVRTAVSGAAKLPVEVAQAMEDRFGVHVDEGYGLTEASPVVTSSAGTGAPFGSVGVPVPGVELRIVDEAGEDVLIGDVGNLLVRGPNVFAGYWHDDEATSRVIIDGWLHTGDTAVVDDQGFLYIVDRAKDLIIVSGFNVFPAEVEDVLLRHPAVEACAVVGVPHPYTGESVRAYVKAREGSPVEEDEIIGFCAANLARYKCPNKVWFVDDVPRGITGKVLRRFLRDAAEADTSGS